MTIISGPVPFERPICYNMAVAVSIAGREYEAHATGREPAGPEAEPVPSAQERMS